MQEGTILIMHDGIKVNVHSLPLKLFFTQYRLQFDTDFMICAEVSGWNIDREIRILPFTVYPLRARRLNTTSYIQVPVLGIHSAHPSVLPILLVPPCIL